MGKGTAALGSALFLIAAPGVVAGVIPWAITGWRMEDSLFWGSRALGGVLIAAGAADERIAEADEAAGRHFEIQPYVAVVVLVHANHLRLAAGKGLDEEARR